jgi:hypothetical protein
MGSSSTAGMTVFCAVLALAACSGNKNQDTPAQAAAKSAASAARARPATGAEQTASMVQAATSGKATAPMQLKFELAERPIAGQTIGLSLALLAGVPAQSATLHFGDSPGLVFADPADRALGAVVPDTVYRQEVQLSASAEGVYFVAVTATMTHDAITETRDFSIPIIVGAQ